MSDYRFDNIFKITIYAEGSYVDHPNDRGGPTNFGITMHTLSTYLGHPVTKDDIKSLSLDDAEAIYYDWYWHKPKIDLILDDRVAEVVFDFGVHAGPEAAIKILQNILKVTVDGEIGIKTIDAINKLGQRKLRNDYVLACGKRLMSIVNHDASQHEFAVGWYNRTVAKLDFGYGL